MPSGISPGGRPIDESPLGKKPLWNKKGFEIPPYIRGVARGISPEDPDSAIDIAVSRVRHWSLTSKNPAVKVAATAAIAEWDAEKAATHNGNKVKKSKTTFTEALGKKHYKLEPHITNKEFSELAKLVAEDDPDLDFEFDLIGKIEKTDPDKQLVFGWLSVAKRANGELVIDKQGDILDDLDQMEAVAYDFVLHSRDGGEMHVRKGVSTLIESFVSTPEKRKAMGIPDGILPDGWWGGFKVNDAEVWKGVKSGKYKMFSVHGTGSRKEYVDA